MGYYDDLVLIEPEYWNQNSSGEWTRGGTPSQYPTSVYSQNPDKTYQSILDQVQQNNIWSANQAQEQMDFQEKLFNKANSFNRKEAELNRAFQQESADRAMAFSSAEAEANRSWQKMMSDTAHQREMADLQAAGLNPILAANNGASAGAGSAALSAQAAGYGASSVGTPSGAKGDTDESGTMAIAGLLGKMLDNQTEITKMITSAETARETAEMYTGATRYAAELGQLASQYASDNALAASRYSADTSYNLGMSNPWNIVGNFVGDWLEAANFNGSTAENIAEKGLKKGLGSLYDKAKELKDNLADTRQANEGHKSNGLADKINNFMSKLWTGKAYK